MMLHGERRAHRQTCRQSPRRSGCCRTRCSAAPAPVQNNGARPSGRMHPGPFWAVHGTQLGIFHPQASEAVLQSTSCRCYIKLLQLVACRLYTDLCIPQRAGLWWLPCIA